MALVELVVFLVKGVYCLEAWVGDLCEDVIRIEKLGVNTTWVCVLEAHDENLRGLGARRVGLDGLHVLKELLEDPNERIVVLGALDFWAKCSALCQMVSGSLERREDQLVLHVRVLVVGGTNLCFYLGVKV